MSDLERSEHLRDEIREGERASAAYSAYFKEYIASKRETLHAQLGASLQIEDKDLVRINMVLWILNDLESEILSKVQTAKLASVELERQD